MTNVLVEWYAEDDTFHWLVLGGTATDLRLLNLRLAAPGRLLPSALGGNARCHALVAVRQTTAAATVDQRIDAFTNDLHRQPRA